MLLAQQDNGPLFEFTLEPLKEDHGIALAVMGILVVFVALVLVVVFITLLPRIVDLLHDLTAPSVGKESEEAASVPATEEGGLSEEIVVVIAAAVANVLERPHRIVQIRGLTPAEMGWSLEGRMLHHHSHRIRGRQ